MSAQKFFEITRRELNKMVTWNDDAPVAEFWEMFDRADWDVAQLRAQAARVEAAEQANAELFRQCNKWINDYAVCDKHRVELEAAIDSARGIISQAVSELDMEGLGECAPATTGRFWLAAHAPAQPPGKQETGSVTPIELASYCFYLADPGSDDILFGLFEDMSADERERYNAARNEKHQS